MDLATIPDIMPETDWFAYLDRGEQMQVDKMLARFDEGDICLVSGEAPSGLTNISGAQASNLELIDYPVDHNTGNILPSNMATVNKDLIKYPLKMYGHVEEFGDLKVHTVADEGIHDHNDNYYAIEWIDVFANCEKGDLIGVWDFLTRNHIKGIIRIETSDYFLTVIEALGYFQRKIQHINSGPQLGLV